MRIQGITSSLVFGALLAISFVFTMLAVGPFVGRDAAAALHLGGGLVAYAAALAPSFREAIRNALAAGLGAVGVLLAMTDPSGLAVGGTIVLAVVRTGLSTSRVSPRMWVAEGLLGVAAIAFGTWIGFAGLIGHAAAIWGYALVQSLYFLVPGRQGRRAGSLEDPFEQACGRLILLLDEE